MRGLVLAAPSSGAGKTTVTLGILRALRNAGHAVAGAKSGPDYIDPQFHTAASGQTCVNLDAWAMDRDSLRARASSQAGDVLLVEGAMGVLDGALPDGKGSAAHLAHALSLPVVLVIDAAKQGQSAALAVAGLRALRPDLTLAGVILNRIGSDKHARMAQAELDVPVFGAIPRHADLALPERHLGLVQAGEHIDLEVFLNSAAGLMATHLDLDALSAAALPIPLEHHKASTPPLGQCIAVARDDAFAFAYPHMLREWQMQGAEILPFSPLRDQGPDRRADAVFLPGGYPELHGATLAGAATFKREMRAAALRGAVIYGECGGYMTLGGGLIDKAGQRHEMLGLLPLTTSFAHRKLTLGYRELSVAHPVPWAINALAAHEFHYATITSEGSAPRLFRATDAEGMVLADMGLVAGNVFGSFAHIIAPRLQ